MNADPNTERYQWARKGDINAFFGLMLDNIAGLILLVTLLAGFGFPVDFALRYMVPGTAIGVLFGDLVFFVMAFLYAKSSGRTDVTAMPLGLDTPSTFGMALLILGPAYLAAIKSGLSPDEAAMKTWHIGMCAILITGVIKAAMAPTANWIHRVFPRAGLLGSLAAIALVLISFSQMARIIENPIVGMTALVVVLITLIARARLPFGIPGALGAVGLATACYYIMVGVETWTGATLLPEVASVVGDPVWFPTEWMAALTFDWINAMPETLPYMGFIVPFAVVTVIGGVDCAESAASVGDRFNTGWVIGTEAAATLLAACCGGVIQTTPYIGHPAYKAMGGRAAYTLATALFIGGAGLIGYFSYIFQYIPEAAVLPILVFIGIEITAQSFHATPGRHYAAIAIGCIPAMAKLVTLELGGFARAIDFASIDAATAGTLTHKLLLLNVLAGGFIFTSLIWASATAKIIDRQYGSAAMYFAVAGVMVMFGVMHSPLPDDQMFLPGDILNFEPASRNLILQIMGAYFVMAGVLMVQSAMVDEPPLSDNEFDQTVDTLV